MSTCLVELLLHHTDPASVVDTLLPDAWKCMMCRSTRVMRYRFVVATRRFNLIHWVYSLQTLNALLVPGIPQDILYRIHQTFVGYAVNRGDVDTVRMVWHMATRGEFACIGHDSILTTAIYNGDVAMVRFVEETVMPMSGMTMDREYVVDKAILWRSYVLAEWYMRSLSHKKRTAILLDYTQPWMPRENKWQHVVWRLRMRAYPTLFEKIQEIDVAVSCDWLVRVASCYRARTQVACR